MCVCVFNCVQYIYLRNEKRERKQKQITKIDEFDKTRKFIGDDFRVNYNEKNNNRDTRTHTH